MGIFKKTKESLYKKGIELYKKKEYVQARQQFADALEMGSNAAAYMLGLFSEKGYAAEKNLEEAMRWYQKADAAGVAEAKEALARVTLLHYGNMGVDAMNGKRYELARQYFEKVLGYGNTTVMYNYAQLLEMGLGGEKDRGGAGKLYFEAADKGHLASAVKVLEAVKNYDEQKWALQLEKYAREIGKKEWILEAASMRVNGRILQESAEKARALLDKLVIDDLSNSEYDRYRDLERAIQSMECKKRREQK